jgi:fumarate reductase flavoprotein subunit
LVVNEQGQIRGVRLTRPDGAIESIGCEALILACNGYGGSIELRTRFIPEMLHATFAGHTGNDGSAVLWGEALGANLADMSAYQGHGSWAMPHGSLVTWALMIQGGIQVNSRGERFHDESQGYSEAAVQVVAQPNQAAWCVYDDPIHTLGMTFPDYIDAQSLGAVKVCDDLSTLAAVIGCPESALTQTLAQTARTEHDQFGRQFARPLRAPFYAIKVTGAIFHTQGGLDVDADCRVKRVDGSRLANLWAAGGAARGVSGPHVSGYLSGNGLLSAVAGGAIAAKSVTTYLKGL